MGIYTFGKTPSNSHDPKINGIQWDYFNGKQWETLLRVSQKVIEGEILQGQRYYTRNFYH